MALRMGVFAHRRLNKIEYADSCWQEYALILPIWLLKLWFHSASQASYDPSLRSSTGHFQQCSQWHICQLLSPRVSWVGFMVRARHPMSSESSNTFHLVPSKRMLHVWYVAIPCQRTRWWQWWGWSWMIKGCATWAAGEQSAFLRKSCETAPCHRNQRHLKPCRKPCPASTVSAGMSGNLGFIQIHGVHTPQTFTTLSRAVLGPATMVPELRKPTKTEACSMWSNISANRAAISATPPVVVFRPMIADRSCITVPLKMSKRHCGFETSNGVL